MNDIKSYYFFEECFSGIKLRFRTHMNLFSYKSLDLGTKAMLKKVKFSNQDKVLDLGCGYGFVGIYAAKLINPKNVVMIDNDINAIKSSFYNAKLNNVDGIRILKSNWYENLQDHNFTKILSNPPFHSDFKVPKIFIEKGFNRLKIDGIMYMVTKRKKWYMKKFISIFGGVKIWEINNYFIFMGIKRKYHYAL